MNRITSLQTRVAIVDDHHLVSAAVAGLLELDPRCKVVGTPRTVAEARALFEREKTDVVLLDLELPDEHGLKLLPLPGGAVACILSMHTDPHFVKEAVAAGALGYVSKFSSPEELRSAVNAVARGETFFSSDVRQAALSFSVRNQQKGLTARELSVLQLAAEGASSALVAAKLGISRRTAEAHRANILKKLSLKSQTDLVRYALRHGIVKIPTSEMPNGASRNFGQECHRRKG
jgi:DNA-binding NarL/FixJ family response regulator